MKFLVLSLTVLFLSAAQAFKSEVRVAEKSTVRVGDPIRLGTLISGHIENSELDEKIYDLVVFEPLTAETERTFRSEELALTLRQKLSFQDLKNLSLKIPEEFKVRAVHNYVYQTDIGREILRQAQSVCSQCEIEFDDLKVPDIKTREEILQTRLETQSLKSAGTFLLPLSVVTSNGKNVYWVTGKVSFYKTAPVAKRMIRSNEPISQSDFEMKKINVSFAKDGIAEPSELAGKVAAHTLMLGQPIFSGDLKKEVAARRGEMVKILIGGDSFEISTSGTAEEAGSVGDVIKVKSSETQKLLSGVLVDKATVKVQ